MISFVMLLLMTFDVIVRSNNCCHEFYTLKSCIITRPVFQVIENFTNSVVIFVHPVAERNAHFTVSCRIR